MTGLWHRLDVAGKTNRQGVPKDPLALGLLWELQDGYLAGIPVSVQKIVFRVPGMVARSMGYERKWIGGRGIRA